MQVKPVVHMNIWNTSICSDCLWVWNSAESFAYDMKKKKQVENQQTLEDRQVNQDQKTSKNSRSLEGKWMGKHGMSK